MRVFSVPGAGRDLGPTPLFNRFAQLPRYRAGAIAALVVLFGILEGCSDVGGGAPPTPTPAPMQMPIPMPTPPPPPMQAEICICPGQAGRLFSPCPGSDQNGELQINFLCSPTNALFPGHMCEYIANSNNEGVLKLLPTDNIAFVSVPITSQGHPFPVVFNTIAQVGTADIFITNLADNTVASAGSVTVSNTCP